jgi:opacity protein-like surface antigen
MRSKLVWAALVALSILPAMSQVAPAARVSGLPLSVGVGLTDFDTDYYQPELPYWSGRMIGISAWVDYSIWHGLGVEVEGSSIFANKPTPKDEFGRTIYGSVKEESGQFGIIYKYHPIHKIRPYVKALGGIGKIDFPSVNPFYTEENAGLYSLGGGLEYKVWRNVNVRADYEHQFWKGFRNGTQSLQPDGFTIGATYYLRGVHRHY